MKKKKPASRKKTAKKSSAKKAKTIIHTPRSSHGFSNADVASLQRELVILNALKDNAEINFCLQLQQILQNSNPVFQLICEPAKAWRVVPPAGKKNALNPSNTKAAGGRVNIGFSQITPHFQVQAFGGIYCSKERKTAELEYLSAGPGKFEAVQLEHKKKSTIEMVDLDSLVSHIDQLMPGASLAPNVFQTPFHANWVMQKFPLASQILGNWIYLNKRDADGIRFHSTKKPGGVNFFLFDPVKWKIL